MSKPEGLLEPVSQSMTYGGAATAVIGGLTLSQIGVVVGIFVGISGLILNAWYTFRKDRREVELHRARMDGK